MTMGISPPFPQGFMANLGNRNYYSSDICMYICIHTERVKIPILVSPSSDLFSLTYAIIFFPQKQKVFCNFKMLMLLNVM